jgi:hypothetical protein
VLWSFVESFLGPTPRAGTLQLDLGPNPHTVAWLEENTKMQHNPSSYSESSLPDHMDNRWNLDVWRQDPWSPERSFNMFNSPIHECPSSPPRSFWHNLTYKKVYQTGHCSTQQHHEFLTPKKHLPSPPWRHHRRLNDKYRQEPTSSPSTKKKGTRLRCACVGNVNSSTST